MVNNLGTANAAMVPKTIRTMMISIRVKLFYHLEYSSLASFTVFPASDSFRFPAFPETVIEVKGMQINSTHPEMALVLNLRVMLNF